LDSGRPNGEVIAAPSPAPAPPPPEPSQFSTEQEAKAFVEPIQSRPLPQPQAAAVAPAPREADAPPAAAPDQAGLGSAARNASDETAMIGADGTTPDAPDAVEKSAELAVASTSPVDPGEAASVPVPPRRDDPETITISIPKDVRVRDRATFLVGKTVYRFASLEGIVKDPCGKSRRCMRRPMRSLKQSIAGASLRCKPTSSANFTLLADCSKQTGQGR
jgi:hypothetical protein